MIASTPVTMPDLQKLKMGQTLLYAIDSADRRQAVIFLRAFSTMAAECLFAAEDPREIRSPSWDSDVFNNYLWQTRSPRTHHHAGPVPLIVRIERLSIPA